MENLDLNAYGVQEMNHQEMVETDGGGTWGLIAATAGFIVAAATPVGIGLGIVAGVVAIGGVVIAAVETELENKKK